MVFALRLYMKNFLEGIFSENLPGLQKSLDLTFRRNQAISSNIANAETPGYRAVDLNFGQELEKAFGSQKQQLIKTDTKHMDISSNSGSHLTPDFSGATKEDGNNVDLDIQMGQLAFNKSRYTQAASMIRRQFSMISNAIRQVA